MVKVLTGEEMRKRRLEHSLRARKMTVEEMHAQMRRNGSVPSPNPWYREPEEMSKPVESETVAEAQVEKEDSEVR